jgi:hypothetical protein
MIRTATQTLMDAMEEFGCAEPNDCMIIWTDSQGDICWSTTSDALTVKLGMIETVKAMIIKGIER